VPDSKRSLTLVLAADSHELHREIDWPSVAGESIFIHARDATRFSRSMAAIIDFNAWLGDLPYTHRIFIPGTTMPS
jgi:hypothetical protein